MTNTEKINAYFDNELNAGEKQQLENRLREDMELKREFDFQKEIIDGIREARHMQLKAMLDRVPVGGAGGATFGTGKVLGVIGIAAVIGFGIYYFYPDNEAPLSENETPKEITMQDNGIVQEDPADELNALPQENNNASEVPAVTEGDDVNGNEADDQNSPATTEQSTPQTSDADGQEADQPREEIKNPPVAPTFENPASNDDVVKTPENIPAGKAVVASSSLEVSVQKDNRKYDFHYQIVNDKLTLYGDFDKELYEILEFNGKDGRSLFLSYQGAFYPLTRDGDKVQPLTEVTNPALLKTLKEAIRE